MKALDDMKISYEQEVSKIKNDDGNWLRFDFEIDYNEKLLYIEYDGRQHFKPATFGGMSKEKAQKAFEKLQKHDKMKNDWCKKNRHPLLRIPYTEFGDVAKLITDFMCKHTEWGEE
jgi:hypothetical protein